MIRAAVVLVSFLPSCAVAQNPATADAAVGDVGWESSPDRIWVGPAHWANPLEDWRVAGGRLECTHGGPNRNVHLLTHQLRDARGTVKMQVRVGRLGAGSAAGSAGFRIGIRSELGDYRSALIHGRGIDAGVTSAGRLFIGSPADGEEFGALAGVTEVGLELRVDPAGDRDKVELIARSAAGDELGRVSRRLPPTQLTGNVALVNHYSTRRGGGRRQGRGRQQQRQARHWFEGWTIGGSRVAADPQQSFGPILWAQHTLSRGVLKMTAQMPPLGEADSDSVRLEARDGEEWQLLGVANIEPQSRTATFRIAGWQSGRAVPYRLGYELRQRGGEPRMHYWTGTVRRDPVDKAVVSVAGFTGNTDPAFPNALLVRNVGIHDPDVLFFSGDQLYEFCGGYGIARTPVDRAILTYLRKYYLFGWAFGDLMRDRPVIILPDDHDVYQGNIWGNGGNAITIQEHQRGGFAMHEDFVNVVMRTQCAHMPDPFDPTPIQRGIAVCYGDMLYGRISIAILEDRKWKAGPKGLVESGTNRPDHVKDPDIDVTKLDVPDAPLLGKRQLEFLRHWAADWRGADMKVACSQTIFANVANYHGGNKQFLVADLDSNGWPQSGRNRALRELRRGFALMYAGDQHLPSIVHHGVDEHRDAGVSFCVPSIAAGYPRSWQPDAEGRPVRNRAEDGLPNTGDYVDGLGNKITVHAIGNPAAKNRPGVLNTLHDKASGYGLIRFDKRTRVATLECWRLQFDAADPGPFDQFPGWPRQVSMFENYGREPAAHLPTLKVTGMTDPVVQVIDQASGDVVYTVRMRGTEFRPPVFAAGVPYRIRIGELGTAREKELRDVRPGEGTLDVDL